MTDIIKTIKLLLILNCKHIRKMEIEEAICILGVTAIESKGKENNKTGET